MKERRKKEERKKKERRKKEGIKREGREQAPECRHNRRQSKSPIQAGSRGHPRSPGLELAVAVEVYKREEGYASGDMSRMVSISITPSLSSALSSTSLAPHTATFTALFNLSPPLILRITTRAWSRLYELPSHAFELSFIFISELLKRRRRQINVVASAYRALVHHTDVHRLSAPGNGSGLSTQGTRTFIRGLVPEGFAYRDDVIGVFAGPAAGAATFGRIIEGSPSAVDAAAATSIELQFVSGTNRNRGSNGRPGLLFIYLSSCAARPKTLRDVFPSDSRELLFLHGWVKVSAGEVNVVQSWPGDVGQYDSLFDLTVPRTQTGQACESGMVGVFVGYLCWRPATE